MVEPNFDHNKRAALDSKARLQERVELIEKTWRSATGVHRLKWQQRFGKQ
jgi:hypothetical protein